MKIFSIVLSAILFTGCFQAYNNDDVLRTVPVTNNPNIIPGGGSMISGMCPGLPNW
jgi:hypothetical protein